MGYAPITIEAQSVHKQYGEESPIIALSDVSFRVVPHEFVSLLGPSGCGKTTLLKIVAGLIPPTGGEIFLDGDRIRGPRPDKVAMVFQSFALLPWRNVIDNIAYGLRCRGADKKAARMRSQKAVELVGLSGFESAYPHELSGGMQQRVGLARALAVDPEVLLMDEPFGALDAQTRAVLQEELLDLCQRVRMTVLFVTHDMDEAVFLSDRVLVMTPRPGRIAEDMTIDLPRPRDAGELAANGRILEYRHKLWNILRDDARAESQYVAD